MQTLEKATIIDDENVFLVNDYISVDMNRLLRGSLHIESFLIV